MIAVWLLLAGCAEPAPQAEDTAAVCAGDLSYGVFGRAFTLTYCDACHAPEAGDRHGAPEAVTFASQGDIARWSDRMVLRVDDGTMPPGGGVAEADRAAFDQWVACGAP